MVRTLEAFGAIRSAAVKRAFLAVPRELFVPEVAARDGVEAVYRVEAALVTRTDRRGIAVSSSSAPSIMAPMLEALDVEPGMRILEVGAGTGYNAALLSLVVGATGRITTIDIDPDIARTARAALKAGGYRGRVFAGDGRAGWPRSAPFDRVIVSASSPGIPLAWRDQLVDGGLLELPLGLGGDLANQVVATFRRRGDVLVSTTVLAGGFMGLRDTARGDSPAWAESMLSAGGMTRGTPHQFVQLTGDALSSVSTRRQRELLATMLEPSRVIARRIRPADADGFALFVSLRAGRHRVRYATPPCFGVGVFSPRDPSVACVVRAVGGPPTIEAWGGTDAERRLRELLDEWRSLGRPCLDDYTLTAAERRHALGESRWVLPCGDFVLGIRIGASTPAR
jgi:protein-L-isoaspartate(D-aspartate) O-methyltransferase